MSLEIEKKICKGPCGLELPLTDFYDSRQGDAVYKFARCKTCCAARLAEHRQTPEGRAQMKVYDRNTFRRRVYGMEPEEYNRKASEQDNRCAICGKPAAESLHGRLAVDHIHETGQNRGLLCDSCNNGLGRFRDNPALLRAAADYIEKYTSIEISDEGFCLK